MISPNRVKRAVRLSESVEGRLDEIRQELRPRLLLLAGACGIPSAKEIADPELTVVGDELHVRWYEYWQHEVYDTPTLQFPLRFLAFSPEEFAARIEEVKAETRAHSPREEQIAQAQARHEADERRRYEQLRQKFG